jgi:hypothetical protein
MGIRLVSESSQHACAAVTRHGPRRELVVVSTPSASAAALAPALVSPAFTASTTCVAAYTVGERCCRAPVVLAGDVGGRVLVAAVAGVRAGALRVAGRAARRSLVADRKAAVVERRRAPVAGVVALAAPWS